MPPRHAKLGGKKTDVDCTHFEDFMQELIERDDENTKEHDGSANEAEIDNDPVASAKEYIAIIKQLKRCTERHWLLKRF